MRAVLAGWGCSDGTAFGSIRTTADVGGAVGPIFEREQRVVGIGPLSARRQVLEAGDRAGGIEGQRQRAAAVGLSRGALDETLKGRQRRLELGKSLIELPY